MTSGREHNICENAETVRVAAPPERLWAVISDIEHYPDRLRSHLAGSGEIEAIRITGTVRVGASFELDVKTVALGSFTSQNRIDDVSEPKRLAWISYPPLTNGETEDHQIEVRWSFELTPTDGGGTDLLHGLALPAPTLGAEQLALFLADSDRVAAIRSGMTETLQRMKLAAEGP